LNYDDDFDVTPVEAQQFVFDLCDTLENRNDIVVKDAEAVTCWIREYKTFVESSGSVFPVADKTDFYTYLD